MRNLINVLTVIIEMIGLLVCAKETVLGNDKFKDVVSL